MPSVWISALKEYNEKKGMWCLPKKGSAEHAEVMKIMDKLKLKAEPVAPEPKRRSTEKTAVQAKEDPAVKPKRKLKAKAPESDSDSDIPVAKPKVRAMSQAEKPVAVAKAPKPKAKAEPPKKGLVSKMKFVPELRTGQEKQDYLEARQAELMVEDFKTSNPFKKKTAIKK